MDSVRKYIPDNRYRKEAKELSLVTVGVQGDNRTESHVIVIAGRIPFDKLETVSTNIINNLQAVNRVTYLLRAKGNLDNARIVQREITAERLDLLREADFKVRACMGKYSVKKDIWQFPVILIPLQFIRGETIVLRPVSSINGMTAEFTKLSAGVAKGIANEVLSIPGIDAVLYDVTNKPPATIEWE